MNLSEKCFVICILYGVWATCAVGHKIEKIKYFAVERPHITHTNPKFISFLNATARRYSRSDPVYYFVLHAITLITADNHWTFNFYFLEFLTNQYKRSFVELHLKGCDLINKDPIFGAAMKSALMRYCNETCPFPPGNYKLQNTTIDAAVMKNFPFPKGRILLNMTYNPTGEDIAGGYIDFQIKEMKANKPNSN